MSKQSRYVLEREDEDFFSSHAGDLVKLASVAFTVPDRVDFISSARGAVVDDVSENARVAHAPKVDRSADFLAGASGSGNAPFTDPALDTLATFLTDGYWGGSAGRRRFDVNPGGTLKVDIGDLTGAGKRLAKWALDAWEDASGLNFKFVNRKADITFDDNKKGVAFSTSKGVGDGVIDTSHVNVGTKWLDAYGTSIHTYSMQTYIHEIGHALGLGHAGNYNGSASYNNSHFTNDSWQASVMSYFSQDDNTDVDAHIAFVLTPQVADIIAIRELYGAPPIRAGDNVYSFKGDFLKYYATRTIVDTDGTDTLDFSWSSRKQTINLNAETFSTIDGVKGNLGISRGTEIEIVIGGRGADRIIGNEAANALYGNGGKDRLTGGGGEDFFVFDTTASRKNVDTIVDFTVGDDTLVFNNKVFTELEVEGTLSAGAFSTRTSGITQNADAHVIYDTDSGKLFYDKNGSAQGGLVLVAQLDTNPALGAGDFLVI